MARSERRRWVEEHAAELVAVASSFGAGGVCLCGSVARGDDHAGSDIDFFVLRFDADCEESRVRADGLVAAYRALCPWNVDVRPLPGWLLGAEQAASMRADAIPLATLVHRFAGPAG